MKDMVKVKLTNIHKSRLARTSVPGEQPADVMFANFDDMGPGSAPRSGRRR